MIEARIIDKHPDDPNFTKCSIKLSGRPDDLLIEYIRINATLIELFRRNGIPDSDIEKILVYCIDDGFNFANGEVEIKEGDKK